MVHLGDQFYADEPTILRAAQNRGSFNLIFLETMFKVDVFVAKDRPFDRQQLARRISEPVPNNSTARIWVLSPEDIILAKLERFEMGGATSERQWRDILGVLRTQQPTIDTDYLKHWAKMLKVDHLLSRALKELN